MADLPEPALPTDVAWAAYQQSRGTGAGASADGAGGRCPACGRWTAQAGEHVCPTMPSKAKQAIAIGAPGVAALGTAGVAAAVLAVGTFAVAAVVAVAVAGSLLMVALRRRARRAMWDMHSDGLERERALRRLDGDGMEAFRRAEDDIADLAARQGVGGQIAVGLIEKGSPGAVRVDAERSVVLVTPDLLRLPRAQVRGVLAHEVAHLQPAGQRSSAVKNFAAAAALPAGIGVAAATGVGLLPAAAVAAAVWFSGKAASSAVSRAEERRADRAAYADSGETYADALTAMHQVLPGSVRHDMPWRAEDVVFTHGNLPNRLADMRAA